MANNSISDVLTQLVTLQNNVISFLNGFNKVSTSESDFVDIKIVNSNGDELIYKVPSFNFLNKRVDLISESLNKLTDFNDFINIRMPDGTYRKLFISKIETEPPKIDVVLNNGFVYKNNWFFENFLNPSLFIRFDLKDYFNSFNHFDFDIRNVYVKRIILNITNDDELNYFKTNINGKSDIDYDTLISDLVKNNISFFVDDDKVDLYPYILNYSGDFAILKYDDIVDNNNNKRRKYFLNKIKYTDNLKTLDDTEELKVGDKLFFNKSVYEIEVINKNENSVILRNISGFDVPVVGSVIKFYSEKISPSVIDVAIGVNEYQVVFFKPLDSNSNIIHSKWSKGVGFYSNDLQANTDKGLMSLKDFYDQFVNDFGLMLLGNAKEKIIPAIWGDKPNPPVLKVDNFKVVLVNEHKFKDKNLEDIKNKISNKIKLESEIKELDNAINQKKQSISAKTFNNDLDKDKVNKELNDLIKDKSSKTELLSSLINDISLVSQNIKNLNDPKYRVRGFFEIPKPTYNDKVGFQYPVQFIIEYRYLSLDNSSVTSNQFEFTDSENKRIVGVFSNWNVIKSDIRKKIFDENTGKYVWADEDVSNPESVNINQIDIPISPGEKVEIRVRTVSESGFPINPLISDYSNVVTIEFPKELENKNFIGTEITNALTDNIKVQFQKELNAKGLDLHLSKSFVSGDKYYAHTADQISSGFFDNSKTLSVYDKILDLNNQLTILKSLIENADGVLDVTIIDPENNTEIKVNNNSNIKLFAGYYEDIVNTLPTNDRKGAIISKEYKMILKNNSSADLVFVSRLPGGLGERLYSTIDPYGTSTSNPIKYYIDAISPPDREYNASRRYDLVPINNLSIDDSESKTHSKISSSFYQSQQLRSQFVYLRYTDVGLNPSNKLYKEGYGFDSLNNLVENDNRLSSNYNPYFRSYFPDDPTTLTGTTASFVWDGTYNSSSAPNGNGVLTNFSIHKLHPYLNDGNSRGFEDLEYPSFNLVDYVDDPVYGKIPITDSFVSPAFSNSRYAPLVAGMKYPGSSSNVLVTESIAKSQLSYRNNWFEMGESRWVSLFNGTPIQSLTYPYTVSVGDYSIGPNTYFLPDKIGFKDVDRFLIGCLTTGAYLFLAPKTFDQLLVDGVDFLAKKILKPGESLEIPIIFQYRMTDFYGDDYTGLGIIGGFNDKNSVQLLPSDKKVNLTYTKKIGIDIYTNRNTVFGFDVEVTAKYRKESSIQSIGNIGSTVKTVVNNLNINKNDLLNL